MSDHDEFIEIWFKVGLQLVGTLVCAIFTCLSFKNLCCKTHNNAHVSPSKSGICAALAVGILFTLAIGVNFSFCALDILKIIDALDIIDWCSPSAPNHYYGDMLNSSLYHMGRFSYYLYLIFNLETHMKYNETIRNSVPSGIILFLKFVIVVCFIEVGIVVATKWMTKDSNYYGSIPYRGYHDAFYCISSLILDISTMTLYIRGLHKYSMHFDYKKRDSDEYIKTKQTKISHELSIKTARWVICFGSSLVFDIITVIINIIYYYCFRHNSSGTELLVAQCVFVFMLTVNDISFVVSVYFSHDFAHRMYECCCKPCDQKMHHCCERRNQKQMKKKMEKNVNDKNYSQLV